MHEYGTKTRLLRVMRAIMENPGGYTKKRLSVLYGVDESTIKNDFKALTDAGFVLEYDSNYRYTFKEEKPFQQLKDLLHFSDEDQVLLEEAIEQITTHDKRGKRLKKKLASIYDFKRLGHSYLRKPYLSKIDLLLKAKEEKFQVVLRDYHSSNSNEINDRNIEPFHISPPEDTIQAFDIDKKEIRHFRISRVKRIHLLDSNWEYEGHHNIMRTDPFRIVDNDQVPVHLRLRVGARNELIERFPATKAYIEEAAEEDIYDFQCMVNRRFLGLTNFILGFHHQLVEVVSPDNLLDHLREQVQKMKF